MAQRCRVLEGHSRRNNLLFFSIEDSRSETWKQSEENVLTFCEEMLDFNIEPPSIDAPIELVITEPIIPNTGQLLLNYFKEKQLVLSKAPRLKGTEYRLSEDFPEEVRKARKELIAFAKTQGKAFKLRHDKLITVNFKLLFWRGDRLRETDPSIGLEKNISHPELISNDAYIIVRKDRKGRRGK